MSKNILSHNVKESEKKNSFVQICLDLNGFLLGPSPVVTPSFEEICFVDLMLSSWQTNGSGGNIALNQECQPGGGIRGKVRGSPKSGEFLHESNQHLLSNGQHCCFYLKLQCSHDILNIQQQHPLAFLYFSPFCCSGRQTFSCCQSSTSG